MLLIVEESFNAAIQLEACEFGVGIAARTDAAASWRVQRVEHVGLCERLESEEVFGGDAKRLVDGGDVWTGGFLGGRVG